MSLIWAESASAATRDMTFWNYVNGTVTSDTTRTKYGGRSIKLTYNTGTLIKNSVLADAGRRITFWFQYVGLASVTDSLLTIQDAATNVVFTINVSAAGVMAISNGGSSKIGTVVLSSNTWYRLTVSYVLTSVSNWNCKLYYATADSTPGTLDVSASNSDFNLFRVSSVNLKISANIGDIYLAPICIDDGTDLLDPGDIRVTAKLPNAVGNANNFSTAIGSATNRWDYIAERPLSTGKGWQETGTTHTEESYGIEAAASGDVDISGKTIIGRLAWLYGTTGYFTNVANQASVQFATKQTTTVLPSISVTNGDYVIIAFADQILGTAVTVAKTAGTSTIGAITQLSGPTTSTVRLTKWYVAVTGTGTLTLTFTHDNSAGKRVGVVGVFNSISASPLDANPTNTSDGTSSHNGPASGTLAQANEIIVGFFAFAGPSTDTIAIVGSTDISIINNGTTGGSVSSNVTLWMIARPVESTSTVTQSMTNATADRAAVQGIVSLKMTVGAGVGSPTLINNGSDVPIVSSGALFITDVVTSASYPSAAGKVGMKSTGNMNDTALYECGMLIIYDNTDVAIPAIASIGTPFGQGGQRLMQSILGR